jgi:hypothetical protein
MTIDCRKRSYINLIQRLGNGQILLDKMKKKKKLNNKLDSKWLWCNS